ncbi:MAG: hypothetical protein HW397_14 [Dehalococcoidia bacterium]|nr:hypothetical protein [Dehalococcoidia bacterium]
MPPSIRHHVGEPGAVGIRAGVMSPGRSDPEGLDSPRWERMPAIWAHNGPCVRVSWPSTCHGLPVLSHMIVKYLATASPLPVKAFPLSHLP